MASYQQLGFDTDDIKSLQRLEAFALRFKDSAPKQHQVLFDLFNQAEGLSGGLPMKIVQYRNDGKIRRIIEAASISLRTIPVQAYRIPGDFKSQSTPIL